MKKLLIVVPALLGGGQERAAANMALAMASHYDVTMAVFDGRDALYSVDCELIDFHIPPAPGKLAKVKNVLLRAAALRKLRREREIDFCVSMGPSANLVNVLSKGRGRTIVRTSAYGDILSKSALDRYVFRHCDRVICCAEQIRERLMQTFQVPPEKAITVYNPLDLDAARQQGACPMDDYIFSGNTVVTHGRLYMVKNHCGLIKAFSLVKAQVPDAQLLIIGEGPLRPRLEALIARYHLQDSVTLLGFRKNPFAYLSRSSVYVLPSYHEGFPNALAEGMCFCPVIATDCASGPREILSAGPINATCDGVEKAEYGILVPTPIKTEWSGQTTEVQRLEAWTDEVTAADRLLADAILALLQDSEKREEMKRRAAERVRDFSFERFREAMERVLDE